MRPDFKSEFYHSAKSGGAYLQKRTCVVWIILDAGVPDEPHSPISMVRIRPSGKVTRYLKDHPDNALDRFWLLRALPVSEWQELDEGEAAMLSVMYA